jgi:hypothetical protein
MKVSSLLKEVMYGGSKALIRAHFTGSNPVLTTQKTIDRVSVTD